MGKLLRETVKGKCRGADQKGYKIKTKLNNITEVSSDHRLDDLIIKCESVKRIDASTRLDIVSALKRLKDKQLNEKSSRAGRPFAIATFLAASIARALVMLGAKPADAQRAAVKTVREYFHLDVSYNSVVTTYNKIKSSPRDFSMISSKGDEIFLGSLNEEAIECAFARLPLSVQNNIKSKNK